MSKQSQQLVILNENNNSSSFFSLFYDFLHNFPANVFEVDFSFGVCEGLVIEKDVFWSVFLDYEDFALIIFHDMRVFFNGGSIFPFWADLLEFV